MKKNSLFILLGVGAGIALAAAGVVVRRDPAATPTASLPPAQSYAPLPSASPTPSATLAPSPTSTPTARTAAPRTSVNLAIPFTVQAPHGNWEDPYGEFCEEASALMAAAYIKGTPIGNADAADAALREIEAFEEKTFGYSRDTTAEETARILREHFQIANVKVVLHPTIEMIREALLNNKAVIVPAAGRQLPNPYFRQPGPLYHMLVVKGFTEDGRFITNDPGTRRGANFLYDPQVLLRAVHDWNGGDVENGAKVMIVVG